MLVPRLYGLGDLTQILDKRAYDQAAAVLESMRSDLNKLVRTGTYEKAARAILDKGFVLLLGQPATGKTTIAAELALAAIDGHGASLIKIDDAADFEDRWNPEEPSQLFWLDDAFGSTQLDIDLAKHWARAVPRVHAALERGARVVLTSRDYIYEAAKPYLKPGSFPLLDESRVVVDVRDLTGEERRQILYNHLKHGNQPVAFLAAIQTHLEKLADHPGFTPELARRLGHPSFTTKVVPSIGESVEAFFARPREYLEDMIRAFDDDAKAALGLIYINRNRLRSPLELKKLDADLLARIGSDLGGVTKALQSMRGSLVSLTTVDRQVVWTFAHPTMSDAYARLLENPEFLPHLASGFPLDVLLGQTTCGDVGIESAIILPPSAYPIVLDRLDEPFEGDWERRSKDRRRRMNYLASRVDRTFLGAYVDRNPDLLDRISKPGMMLDAVSEVDVAVRLWRERLLPEERRAEFAETVIGYCVTGQDPGVLWMDGLREMLTPEENETFRLQMKEELIPGLRDVFAEWESTYGDYSDPPDPYDHMRHLEDLLHGLELEFPEDEQLKQETAIINQAIEQFVAQTSRPEREYDDDWYREERPAPPPSPAVGRSVFDDLLD